MMVSNQKPLCHINIILFKTSPKDLGVAVNTCERSAKLSRKTQRIIKIVSENKTECWIGRHLWLEYCVIVFVPLQNVYLGFR